MLYLIKLKVMRNTQHITKTQLVDLLTKIDGKQATFISIVAEVDARLKKRGNKYSKDSITKINKYSGLINYNYQNSVNNQREREGIDTNFVSKATYASKINDKYNGCLAQHDVTGQVYLVFKEQSSQKPIYKINGAEVDDETEQYLKQFRSESPKSVSQGVDKTVEHRNVKIENIKTIILNSTEYVVI
jgi:hypothetical protein